MIEITWQFTWNPALDNYVMRQVTRRAQPSTLALAAILLVFMTAGMGIASLVAGDGAIIGVVIGVFVGWGSVMVFSQITHRNIRIARGKAPLAAGPWVVTATPRGTEWRKPGVRASVDWRSVTEIASVPGAILVQNSAVEALALPDEGLPAGVSHGEALKQLRAWLAEAQP